MEHNMNDLLQFVKDNTPEDAENGRAKRACSPEADTLDVR
jgi:hypothetical protein